MIFNYELTLIVDGRIVADKSKKVVEKVKTHLPKDAKIVKEDSWGSRELAYPIQKATKGTYLQINFEADSAGVKDLNRLLNIEEGLLRFLLMKHDEVKPGKVAAKPEAKVEKKAEKVAKK